MLSDNFPLQCAILNGPGYGAEPHIGLLVEIS